VGITAAMLSRVAWAQQDCSRLAELNLSKVKIVSADLIPAAVDKTPTLLGVPQELKLPAYCKVKAEAHPTADSLIKFELWMPVSGDWNGEFLQLGNGGLAGSINTAGMTLPLSHNFAVAATDDGHTGSGTDGSWAMGHPEKVIDFGYRAVHETSMHSREVIAAFYGKAQKYSYFNGCSEGGREAMMEAQRFPQDFNGIIAGSAAGPWMELMAAFAWNSQALLNDPASYIPEAKRPAIEKAALAACGTQQNVTDLFIKDPLSCKFNPSTLLCKAADTNDCLTAAQVIALKKIYWGPVNGAGKRIGPGYEAGAEAEPGPPGLSYASYIYGPVAGASLDLIFSSAFYGNFIFDQPKYSSLKFDFDKDVTIADQKVGAILNATNPDLNEFKTRGGKLIAYQGWEDGSPAPRLAVNYHDSVVRQLGGERNVDSFYRLFMAPGMMHCGLGPGPNAFGDMLDSSHYGDPQKDIFAALRAWVEQNQAPDQIIATKYQHDLPSQPVVMTRPLCPYPAQAVWNGKGSSGDATNWSCSGHPIR
jgi:feruloyl esterase